jgi:aldoxime dehydratase
MQRSEQSTQDRIFPLRMPKGHSPKNPVWSSTFPDHQTGISMAALGFQHFAEDDMGEALAALRSALENSDALDTAVSTRTDGMRETLCIAYWRDAAAATAAMGSKPLLDLWKSWANEGKWGLIRECANIPFERTETIFSTDIHNPGYSQMRTGTVGPIDHHEYWGGMRDRIARSAYDDLSARSEVIVERRGERHSVVLPHENLCIIRSGQDWSQCDSEQLAEYTDTIEPTLKEGMAFLRDQGSVVNCYSCRYMRVIGFSDTDPKQSFGFAYFRALSDLESWAQNHPTHLKIFNTALETLGKRGSDIQLRLWHEVSVLPAEGCWADYINCRAGTGWLPR